LMDQIFLIARHHPCRPIDKQRESAAGFNV
jgi:hypothetical protein